MNASDDLLTSAAMDVAAARIAPHVLRTPVMALQGRHTAPLFTDLSDVSMKLELFQRTGTFKVRGALNAVMSLDPEARKRGITAVSAGNHAIAAAFAASVVGVSARLVVLASASPVRIEAARAYGAEIVVEADGASAFARAEQLVRDEGRAMIHPFEGPLTAAGTATVGMEMMQDLPGLDALVVAVGGGGLAGGLAAAVHRANPGCRVIGVEPEGADAMRRSFDAGEPVRLAGISTIADSLAPPMALPYAYALCRRHLEQIVTVSDDDLCHGMALLFHDAKLAVEPAAAAALAAVVGPLRETLQGLRVGIVICGANIDSSSFSTFLQRGERRLAGA